jgi:hypothetical protein
MKTEVVNTNPKLSLKIGIGTEFLCVEGVENTESRTLKQTKIIHYLQGALAGTTKKMNLKCRKILNQETLHRDYTAVNG